MRRLILVGLTSCFLTSGAFAQVTGNDWKDYCNAPEHTEKYAMCLGYFSGSLDGIRLMERTTGAIILCEPPAGVTVPQLIAIIRRYLDQHPEQLHFAAASIVPKIVNEAFPCQSR
jgi:hypothetical protein